ncbi:putative two-component transcriptional regulator, LuxR family [Bradyrhizobium sp. ORS 375]|uniref:response regulator n=1 Tax=Bradyrhizobium sp. (strain ORS 375) TaxID=566679 RepID=UPI00024075CD|nr:response regulator transcription factor [Bradyrhizobium sp. ORS 375]CCD97232.1 putative two-component transcriptional regulator, LuxR family [Bradyrhizobium sp. ORS 375]
MTRFLIIDDHPLFREALGNAVRLALPDAQIFEALSIADALNILGSQSDIDLALLDLTLPDAAGFSGFLRLRAAHPRLPVAIVSSEEDQHVVREALSLGAAGYLPKSTSKRELTAAIERVLSGSVSVPKDLLPAAERGGNGSSRALQARLAQLTPQQLRVLDLIRRGYQNRDIAGELQLAESTVKAHITEILRKLRLYSRNKAVVETGKIDLHLPTEHQNPRNAARRKHQ